MTARAALSRRTLLQVLACGPMLATGSILAFAGEALIQSLMVEAQAFGLMSQRIDFISRALLGTRYQAHTLIGGPRREELFVVRDDAFDCVTFCEMVLAAALAHDLPAFEAELRRIRYRYGNVKWKERNHYFAEWSGRVVDEGICRRIGLGGAVALNKTVNWHPALGKQRLSLSAIPRAAFLANMHRLSSGDIVGFVSRRPWLDYFHVGFAALSDGGELLLRHASKSRGRVVQENMARFVDLTEVRYVTLLRPVNTVPAADLA